MTNEVTPNLITLSRTEAKLLQNFISQVDTWQYQYGEKANTIEIQFFPEDEGFEVSNNEPNNGVLKRNRATIFRTEILSWANVQLKDLQGWQNENTVKVLSCVYKNGEYGVAVEAVPTANLVNAEPTDELDKQE